MTLMCYQEVFAGKIILFVLMSMLESRERQQSAYRSVRYSTIRKESFTADVTRMSLNRMRKKPLLESTFYNTRTIEMRPQNSVHSNPERMPYLESFHSMLNSQKAVKLDDDIDFKTCELKVKFSSFDQNYLKDDDTEFTLLDPFHRPYTYLTRELNKADRELKSQQDDMRHIRAQLAILKHNALASLKSSEEEGMTQIQRLRTILKKNETAEQERKMRVRREITDLYEQQDINNKMGEDVLSRLKGMQLDIFSCQPFELQVGVQQGQPTN